MPRGEANYYDVLGADAFGNFRTLLQDVTLNPMMGQFLNMLGNDKGNATTDPDENYAREVMQLFTIGLYQLNDDGSQQLDATGSPIPTYSNTDVMGLAAVFTGFSWNDTRQRHQTQPGRTAAGMSALGTAKSFCRCRVSQPPLDRSEAVSWRHHSCFRNAGPDGDLKLALDTIFNHPNLPPFFCKQMIQHLVTSNPSPTYISNCSAVFKNDGTGVRGNLQAVISEILHRPGGARFRHRLRQSAIRQRCAKRSFAIRNGRGRSRLNRARALMIRAAPKIRFTGSAKCGCARPRSSTGLLPDYVPPATTIEAAGLVAPEMQMTNVSTVVGYINYMQGAIGSNATSGPDLFSSYETEMSLAATPNALLDRINLLLMAGEMDSDAL
jgi:hypothetical protein